MVKKKDIAKALKLSPTAVCQVLNNTPNASISKVTRQRILEQAQLMGYVAPNRNRGLCTIAYILCEKKTAGSLYLPFLAALHNLVMEEGRQIGFFTASDNLASRERLFYALDQNPPMGVVLDGHITDEVVDEIRSRKIPLVVYGSSSMACEASIKGLVSTVKPDVRGEVFQIMKWFADRGCKRVFVSMPPMATGIGANIYEAYRESMSQLGLAFDPALAQMCDGHDTEELVRRLTQLGLAYDAILFSSVARATRVLLNIKPDELSVGPLSIGVLGSLEAAADFSIEAAICGSSIYDCAAAVYKLLSQEINYARKRKTQVTVPSRLLNIREVIIPRVQKASKQIRKES